MNPLDSLNISHPILQAPMAGVSTPELAANVSNAGALGAIGIGASDVQSARKMIEELRCRTDRAFNVNVFVHAPASQEVQRESEWIAAMHPLFESFEASPPIALHEIYTSFVEDDGMLALLVELAPPVVSFHFGVPDANRINVLKQAGCMLLATATSLCEAEAAQQAGMDAVVAQGFEAGGHRGVFDPSARDDCMGTLALTRLLVSRLRIPVIAAGGIMDGRGIRAVLDLGAAAGQLGTAFIACPESSADEAYRTALFGPGAGHTVMTQVISGRPARCLPNSFTRWGERNAGLASPDYPIAYDAGKALNAAAKAKGDSSFGAQWAGQGAPLARSMPAAELINTWVREM